MRALLLLLLGVGLVWFVWRGFGAAGPTAVAATEAAPGAMIAIETTAPTAEVSEPEPGARPLATSPEPAPGAIVAVPESTAGAPSAGLVPVADRGSSSGEPARMGEGREAEIPAAAQLLRDPAGLDAWLVSRGASLPDGRREFASGIVFALAARGPEAEAALDRAQSAGGLAATERQLVRHIADRPGEPAPISSESPLARAASMKALERAASTDLREGRGPLAAVAYSRLLLAEVASPWPADPELLASWSDQLREAQRTNRWNRRGNWPSREVIVKPGDSLTAIRQRAVAADPTLKVCTGQIARANQLAGEMIHPGDKLRIPLDPASVLVDLDAHWVFYLTGDEVAAAWPVGVGKESSATRVGTFTVGDLTREPMWFPQGRKPVPYGDPENPLGTRWISWDDADGRSTGLGFHGTNEPESIGRDASLGCIRMRTPDVEALYEILPRGARVVVVP